MRFAKKPIGAADSDRPPVSRPIACCVDRLAIDPSPQTAYRLGMDIPYTVESSGNVGIVVQNPAGQTVREIQRGVPTQPGSYTATWDGLDRYGVPMPPADYKYVVGWFPGFSRTLACNVGINTPWAPMDRWPGNHLCPNLLYVAPDGSGVYISSPSSEGPPSFMKMALDGSRKIWDSEGIVSPEYNLPLLGMAKVPNTGGKLTGVCAPGNIFYQLTTKLELKIVRDDVGGLPGYFTGTALNAVAQKGSILASLLHAGDTPVTNPYGVPPPGNSPVRMAGGPDFIAITYQKYNEVRFLYPRDAAVISDITVTVPTPGDVTVTPAGLAYVVSGNNIVSVDPVTGTVTSLFTPMPIVSAITYDPAFGDLLAICNGCFINRYEAGTGNLIATYGSPNGRAYGLFDAYQFDALLDVEADGSGGFWTAESHPRRVAHFGLSALPPETVVRTATRALVLADFPEIILPSGQVLPEEKAWAFSTPTTNFPIPGPVQYDRTQPVCIDQHFGGFQWGSTACLDPAAHTVCYLPVDELHIGRGRIDYSTNTWHLEIIYDAVSRESWTLGSQKQNDFLTFGGERIFWRVMHVAGQTYLVQRGGGNAQGRITVVRVDDTQNKLYPVAQLSAMHPTNDRTTLPPWFIQRLALPPYNITATDFNSAGQYKYFANSFSDLNGDGIVDLSEISLATVGSQFLAGSAFVNTNWNVTKPNLPGATTGIFLWIKNEGTASVPVWNWNNAVGFGSYMPGDVTSARLGAPISVWLSDDGYYSIANNTTNTSVDPVSVADCPPTNWPDNLVHSERLTKHDFDGNPLWSAGVHRDCTYLNQPGWAFGSLRLIAGEVNGCIVIVDGCRTSVWTKDGMYAGCFYDDVPAHAADAGWQKLAYPIQYNDNDQQWGDIVQDATSGNVYWVKGAYNSTPIYKITGWDGWQRQTGTLTVTEPATAASGLGTGLTASYNGGPPRIDPSIWFGPLNGNTRTIAAYNLWPVDPTQAENAVWTGFIEAPLSEDFTFYLYDYASTPTSGAQAKLCINDIDILDMWTMVTPSGKTASAFTRVGISQPVSMRAGQKLPIRIDYSFPGNPNALLHLYWQSTSLDLRHVPKTALIPA